MQRVRLCLVLTFGLLVPPALASQSSDQETIRALTTKYGQTIAAGDFDAMRAMWNDTSPNLKARLAASKTRLSVERIEFLSMNVTRVEVTGDRALSHLTTDERRREKKTGAIVLEQDAFHGICRELNWIRTSEGWKVQGEVVVRTDSLRSFRVGSDQDRETFLSRRSYSLRMHSSIH
jgi:hypothetical protein